MTDIKKQVIEWADAVEDTVVDVGKRLKHLPSLEIEKIQTHLQIESISDATSVSSVLSKYQQFIQTAVLEDYLRKSDYTIVEKCQCEYGSGVFEYVDIEIDVDKTVKAVGYGHLFLTNRKTSQRLVLQLEDLGGGDYKIRVFVKDGEQDDALKVITGLAKYAKENNILKNKNITPTFHHIKLNPTYTWESVILPELTKKEIKQNVDLLLKNIDTYKRNDLTFKRGLILKGPPGTGKTLIGKVLCNTIKDTTFIWVTPGDLVDVRRIKFICELARELSPSILFLEDIDLYGSHRENENRGILGELMNQLDGLIENEFVIVVATTNRPDEIEGALRNRPGRFDRVIDVPLPDADCRARMFKLFLSNLKVQVKDEDKLAKALAENTHEFTGAHVKELVNSAIISAIDENSLDSQGKVVLKIRHFQNNIESVKEKTMTAVGFTKINETDNNPTRPSLDDDY